MRQIELRNGSALVLLAAFQGLIVYPNMAIQLYFLYDLKLSPGQLSIFNGIINYVWVLKALFGFVVDSIYLGGYRRKSNLLIFTILGAFGWVSMGWMVASLATAVLTKLLINFGLGFINTVAEAVMVEMSIGSNSSENEQKESKDSDEEELKSEHSDSKGDSNDNESSDELVEESKINKKSPMLKYHTDVNITQTSLETKVGDKVDNVSAEAIHQEQEDKRKSNATNFVSIFMASSSFFTMIGIYLGGISIEHLDYQVLFKITLCLGGIPLFVVFCMYEKRNTKHKINKSESSNKDKPDKKISKGDSLKQRLRVLKIYLGQGFVLKPALFIFLVLLTPSIDSVMFSYQTFELKFTPSFMSYISIATSVVNIGAVLFYRSFLQDISLKKIITLTTLSMSVCNLLKLLIIFKINDTVGINTKIGYMISEGLYSFANEIHLMPIMIMACRIGPKKVEATVYEFIMSIINLGYLISYQSGGFLSEWLNITSTNFTNLWIQVMIASVFPCILLGVVFIIPSDFSQRVENFSRNISEKERANIDLFDRHQQETRKYSADSDKKD